MKNWESLKNASADSIIRKFYQERPHLMVEPSVDMGNLTDWLGVEVCLAHMPMTPGRLERNPPKLYVNLSQPQVTRRFIQAHLLGHLLLHDGDEDNLDPIKEKQAHEFACQILMPTAWVINRWELGMGLPLLAATFNVSEKVLKHRALSMGLIGV